ncbi:MAG: type II secretion system F family protein [Janthinobacterium lividum]
MNLAAFLAAITLLLLAVGASSMLLFGHISSRNRFSERVRQIRDSGSFDNTDAVPSAALSLRILIGLGNTLARSGLLSANTLTDLRKTLVSSGFRGSNSLSLFISSKLVLLVALPLLVVFLAPYLTSSTRIYYLVVAFAAVGGMLLPDMAVRRLRERFLQRLERGLPDALDMLIICSEAGLGLETSIERVSLEMSTTHPEVSQELGTTAHELRVVSDRRQAFVNMSSRTGLPSVKRLVTTLVQTMQYGTPLSQALRNLSAEMRQEMLVRFEARAARLPVLLTLPMIIFILPTLFMIVGGPAVLSLSTVFSH